MKTGHFTAVETLQNNVFTTFSWPHFVSWNTLHDFQQLVSTPDCKLGQNSVRWCIPDSSKHCRLCDGLEESPSLWRVLFLQMRLPLRLVLFECSAASIFIPSHTSDACEAWFCRIKSGWCRSVSLWPARVSHRHRDTRVRRTKHPVEIRIGSNIWKYCWCGRNDWVLRLHRSHS